MPRRNRGTEPAFDLRELGKAHVEQQQAAWTEVDEAEDINLPHPYPLPQSRPEYKIPVAPVRAPKQRVGALPTYRPQPEQPPKVEQSRRYETMLDRAVPARIAVGLFDDNGAMEGTAEVYGYAYKLEPNENYWDEDFKKSVNTAICFRELEEAKPNGPREIIGTPWEVGENDNEDLYEVFPLRSRGLPTEFKQLKGRFLQLSIESMSTQDFCTDFNLEGSWQYYFAKTTLPQTRQQPRDNGNYHTAPANGPQRPGYSGGSQQIPPAMHGDGLDHIAMKAHELTSAVETIRNFENPYPQTQSAPQTPSYDAVQPIPTRPKSTARPERTTGGYMPSNVGQSSDEFRHPENVRQQSDVSTRSFRTTDLRKVDTAKPTSSVPATAARVTDVAVGHDKPDVEADANAPTYEVDVNRHPLREWVGGRSKRQKFGAVGASALLLASGAGYKIFNSSPAAAKTTSTSVSANLKSGQEYAWNNGRLCVTNMARIATKGTVDLAVASHGYDIDSKGNIVQPVKPVWIQGLQQLDINNSALNLGECAPNTAVILSHKGNSEVATIDLSKLAISSSPLGGVSPASQTFAINKINSRIAAYKKTLLKKYPNDAAMQAKIKSASIPVKEKNGSKTNGFDVSALDAYNKTIATRSYVNEYEQLVTAASLARTQKNSESSLEQAAIAPIKDWLNANAKKNGIKSPKVNTIGTLPSISSQYLAANKKTIKNPLADTVQLDGAYRDGMVQASAKNISGSVAKQTYKVTTNPTAKGGA